MSSDSGPNWRIVSAVVAPLLLAFFMAGFDNPTLLRTLPARLQRRDSVSTGDSGFCDAGHTVLRRAAGVNFPRFFKPIATALRALAAGVGYSMNSCGVIIDDAMFRNLAQTDRRQSQRAADPRFQVRLLVFGVAPAAIVVPMRLHCRPWLTEM